MSTRLLLTFFWLIHWLPFPALRGLGAILGEILYRLANRRRKIGLRNLELCFPEWHRSEKHRVLRRHFREMASSFLCYSILLFASPRRIERLARREGIENYIDAAAQGPVILLAPHFLSLDFGGVRHTIDYSGASMYSTQRLGTFDRVLLRVRGRFNNPQLIARHEGIRPCVRALKNGLCFYYLPDQDLGPRESIFAPFFGIPTATIPALSRLTQMSGAQVVPMVTEMTATGFVTRYYPVWKYFPTDGPVTDATRMNAFIEERIREIPSQYYWLHRRFKTRPEGAASLY